MPQGERDIQVIIDVAQTLFVSPFSKIELVCISNGMIGTKQGKDDLLSAEKKGRAAINEFVEYRLVENANYANQKDEVKDIANMKKLPRIK